MKSRFWIITAIVSFTFLMISLMLSFVFRELLFIAEGTAPLNAFTLLNQYPLNIVFYLNMILFAISVLMIFRKKE